MTHGMDERAWEYDLDDLKEHLRDEERSREALKSEREKWALAHPLYCRTCEGWGSTDDGWDRDTGIYNIDPCPDCIEEYRCPWCGSELQETADGEELRCDNRECNWVESDDGMPQG